MSLMNKQIKKITLNKCDSSGFFLPHRLVAVCKCCLFCICKILCTPFYILIVTFFILLALYVLLNAQFLGIVQIIVYAGAIMGIIPLCINDVTLMLRQSKSTIYWKFGNYFCWDYLRRDDWCLTKV